MNYSKNTQKVKHREMMKRRRIRTLIVLSTAIFISGIGTGRIFSKVEQGSIETLKYLTEVKSYKPIDENISVELVNEFKPLDVGINEDVQEFIYCLSNGYDLDYSLVMGLIQTESTFDPKVISSTNDYGLMQINKTNHKWLKEKLEIDDFLNPYQNVRSGIYILKNLFEKYEDPEKVLMAYNMGESGAKKLWNRGIYETDYTNKVLSKRDKIQDLMNERMVKNE